MQVLPCDSEHLPLSYHLCTFDPLNYSPCGRCRPRSLHGTQPALDVAVIGFDTVIAVLRTAVRSPKANGYCERIVRTVRRECLDFLIPLSEKHLKRTLVEWVAHYNHGRPHRSLGPGIPLPLEPLPEPSPRRHHIPNNCGLRRSL